MMGIMRVAAKSLAFIYLLVLLISCGQTSVSHHLDRIATTCWINGEFPDVHCTPGATFPNVMTNQICTPGYTQTVRNVSTSIKTAVYAEYGIIAHKTGQYEIDHFIPLELGGSNDAKNLWPEAALPVPGFREKDRVENYLHNLVCNGKITLQEGQKEISTNWREVYDQLPK